VVRKYDEALRCVVLPRIGRVPAGALTQGDVQRMVDEVASHRTVEHARKALTALRVALRVAARYGELGMNPCSGVRVPASAEPERRARVVTPEEAAAITTAAGKDDARMGRSFAAPLIALAFGTGARLGELLALPWGPDGLDLDRGMVHVRRSIDRVRDAAGVYPFIAPKSRASRRDVPLAPDDIVRMRRHQLATGRPPVGALVFAAPDGTPLSPIPAQRAFKRACKVAAVEAPSPASTTRDTATRPTL